MYSMAVSITQLLLSTLRSRCVACSSSEWRDGSVWACLEALGRALKIEIAQLINKSAGAAFVHKNTCIERLSYADA